MRYFAIKAAIFVFLFGLVPAHADGRLGVCYKCVQSNGITHYLWSERTNFSFPDLSAGKCRGLSNIEHTERAPSNLCDATDGISRWPATNDPFFPCSTGNSDHAAWLGGENLDLVVLAENPESFRSGTFYRVQDGEEYSCGGDLASGANFTALRYGNNRDLVDIYIHKGDGVFERHTDRIQDGKHHKFVVGGNYVARIYGRKHDIVKLYGIRNDGGIVSVAQWIADGQGHLVQRLSATDVGVTYGRNKDINVRFCFDGARWMTGYIGIGHPFKDSCDTVLNW